MNNKIYLNAGLALLTGLGLAACNGGNSTSSTTNTEASPLQQYINSLTYTPANGKSLTAGGAWQQSFTTPGGVTINSVDIKYYSGANCGGSLVSNTTLSGGENGVNPAAGTYTSSNASNNALCGIYDNGSNTGCDQLYADMAAGAVRSIQYTYNIYNGSAGNSPVSLCLYNPNAEVGATTGVEGIANWSASNVSQACTGGTCGFSQPYNITFNTMAVFFSSTLESGNLGGIAGADAICASDPQATTYCGTYKAYLVDGINRVACTTADCSGGVSEHTNWVLQPDTMYKFYFTANESAVRITTVNGIFSGNNLGVADFNYPTDDFNIETWTGLNTDATTATGYTCNSWSSGSYINSARSGYINALYSAPEFNKFDINTGDTSYNDCSASLRVMCVQQPLSLSITPQNLTLASEFTQSFTATISQTSVSPVEVTFTPTVTASTCLWNKVSFPTTSCMSTFPRTVQGASCTIAAGDSSCSVNYVTQGSVGLSGVNGVDDITLSVSATGYLGAATTVTINTPS